LRPAPRLDRSIARKDAGTAELALGLGRPGGPPYPEAATCAGSSTVEYDFVLAPAADPHAIRMRFPGAQPTLSGGDLVVGNLRHHRPFAWQDTASGRHYIEAGYRLRDGEVTFALGAYDATLPLVIDPVLVWATFAGGSGAETGSAVAVDATGNVYLGGTTDSSDFTLLKATPASGTRGYIARLDPTGANVLASAVIAGATVDALALDATGALIATGSILSTAFPKPTAGAVAQDHPTGYVARFTVDASGFKLAFLATIAATPSALALDTTGAIYLTGTAGVALPSTPGVVQPANAGGSCLDPNTGPGPCSDAFVLKLSADGAKVIYATYLGGTDQDTGRAIAVNSGGEVYVAGDTASANFWTSPGASQPRFGGKVAGDFAAYGDGFVTKLDANGATFVFSTFLGGAAPDIAWSIAVDKDGNAFVAGGTQSSDFPVTPGAFQTKYGGGTLLSDSADPAGDGFVTKFSTTGERAWSTFIGGSGRDVAAAVALDASGNVYAAGSSESANFPWTADAVRGCHNGGPWVAQFDPAGAKLVRSSSIGGMGFDQANALALDTRGAVYLAGETTSRAFFSSPSAAQKSYGGGDSDAFAAKLDWQGAPQVSVSCVLNAASFAAGNFAFYPQGTVAPGEVVSIFGGALGPDQAAIAQPAPGAPYPTTLGGTQVFFDGVPAAMWYAGPNQINAVVPYAVKAPATQMTVQRNGATDGPRILPVAAAVPGIFTATGTGQGQAAVFNEDGSYNSPANPAARGSIIVLYAVGAGAMTPAQRDGEVQPTSLPLPAPAGAVSVQIRGTDAKIVYAGAAPGYIAGLLQLNVVVPDAAQFGDSVPLMLTIGGQASQFNVTIAVAK
ncbi:MAG TPA: SBBP repeat-containing protein, partial [Candidatus Acidoferrum sp.]|nr:SBBP repeat-containing protein [Candidatus Acidoferrum sp.]